MTGYCLLTDWPTDCKADATTQALAYRSNETIETDRISPASDSAALHKNSNSLWTSLFSRNATETRHRCFVQRVVSVTAKSGAVVTFNKLRFTGVIGHQCRHQDCQSTYLVFSQVPVFLFLPTLPSLLLPSVSLPMKWSLQVHLGVWGGL